MCVSVRACVSVHSVCLCVCSSVCLYAAHVHIRTQCTLAHIHPLQQTKLSVGSMGSGMTKKTFFHLSTDLVSTGISFTLLLLNMHASAPSYLRPIPSLFHLLHPLSPSSTPLFPFGLLCSQCMLATPSLPPFLPFLPPFLPPLHTLCLLPTHVPSLCDETKVDLHACLTFLCTLFSKRSLCRFYRGHFGRRKTFD